MCGNNRSYLWNHKIELLRQPRPNKKNLAPFGYYSSKITPGIWHHKTIPIKFSLVIVDFGVKYVNKEYSEHLLDSIKTNYLIKVDFTGGNTFELT